MYHAKTTGKNNYSFYSSAMGKSLNLRMVAEGLDDIEQFHFLRKQGIQIIQGYLFSQPVPANQFAKLLTETPYLNHGPSIITPQFN
jgi:EAL domain-containing protein (putative c-di-GMP-specific phosphodiesterase class I)